MAEHKRYDVAVIGAGVFGSWIASHLQKLGTKVVLLDAYGAANARASSGGESRIIRMGYGADELYTRWAMRSLELWQAFFQGMGERLFHPTGVLWMAREATPYTLQTLATLRRLGVRYEMLSGSELEARDPQCAFGPVRDPRPREPGAQGGSRPPRAGLRPRPGGPHHHKGGDRRDAGLPRQTLSTVAGRPSPGGASLPVRE